jgi:hypothetical protein
MPRPSTVRFAAMAVSLGAVGLWPGLRPPARSVAYSPTIPRTWEDSEVVSLELPLADARATPVQAPEAYYYRIPVRPIYKTYPTYAPDREPPGYMDWLARQEPVVLWDEGAHRPRLSTEADWIAAGKIVFEAPTLRDAYPVAMVREPGFHRATAMPVAQDGRTPFLRYAVQEKGKVEVQGFACAMCHTRVMPDGQVIEGAQGNFPLFRVDAFLFRSIAALPDAKVKKEQLDFWRTFFESLYRAPWMKPDPYELLSQRSLEDYAMDGEGSPPGQMARTGTSPLWPVQIPDLIGVKERRYLDRTGLVRHRNIGDLMRYGALNQGMDLVARYVDFVPAGVNFRERPDPKTLGRYSDEQLYAMALYLYSLEPPPNPHALDPTAKRGATIFEREGCIACHTPPAYTSNKLTPASGFTPPADHSRKYDILPVSLGTDPNLALRTRRGTGYYKVPSLRGVWYRGPFEHSGSVATLEDWFDPGRLQENYVPTGFKGYRVQRRAVRGHEFGLRLSADDRKALIAFLMTL